MSNSAIGQIWEEFKRRPEMTRVAVKSWMRQLREIEKLPESKYGSVSRKLHRM
jgi:hypothetical protein